MPRFGERCPPFLDTTETISWRISSERFSSSFTERFFISCGDSIFSRSLSSIFTYSIYDKAILRYVALYYTTSFYVVQVFNNCYLLRLSRFMASSRSSADSSLPNISSALTASSVNFLAI